MDPVSCAALTADKDGTHELHQVDQVVRQNDYALYRFAGNRLCRRRERCRD